MSADPRYLLGNLATILSRKSDEFHARAQEAASEKERAHFTAVAASLGEVASAIGTLEDEEG